MCAGATERTGAYRSVSALVGSLIRPTAIFAPSDIGAISAIWAARDGGLRIPDDLAVVGVGDVPEGRAPRPTLSSVGPVLPDFGDVAEHLFDRLAPAVPPPGRIVVRPWSFFPRGSGASPPPPQTAVFRRSEGGMPRRKG